MRARRVDVVLVLFLVAASVTAPSARAAEVWKMRIHRGGTVTEHVLAEVDSVTFYADTTGVELVRVPSGSFVMGDGAAACGIDERTVTITRDFHLAAHEVTNAEFRDALQWAFDHGHVTATAAAVRDALDGSSEILLRMDNDFCEIQFDGTGSFFLREAPSPEAQAAYPGGYDPADHPVKEATWYGAAAFCDWLSMREGFARAYDHATWRCNGGEPYGAAGYRLPTDAEWEYAAQFDDERAFPWGNESPDCARANFNVLPDPCVGWTVPPRTYPDAPAALGLSNLAGNIWELCNDWFTCSLGTAPATDPAGPATGVNRVARAGGFGSVDYDLRCSFRAYTSPGTSTYAHGFRVARTAGP